jgi:hypothetical protein
MAPVTPVLGHLVSGNPTLPVPLWLLAYGSVTAVVIAFAALGAIWPTSRLEDGVDGVPLPDPVQAAAPVVAIALRAVGLIAFAGVFISALVGAENPDTNFAPWAIFVLLWLGVAVVSALVGDVWAVLSPFDTLCAIGQWLVGRAGRSAPAGEPNNLPDLGYWPAVVFLFGFVWLELVYPRPNSGSGFPAPRALASAMAVYSAAVLAGAGIWGRQWLRESEAFAAWFGLLGRMAPLYRGDDGRLRLRLPLTGLAAVRARPGLPVLVMVVVGSTAFDGLTRTPFWQSLLTNQAGQNPVVIETLGLAWMVGIVAIVYFASIRLTARITEADAEALVPGFVHSLVPIAFVYTLAHYFTRIIFDSQNALTVASDPLGRGWNLFGTGTWLVHFFLSGSAIVWLQTTAIVTGHVGGLVLVHDRAVARYDSPVATRSQYPLLAAVVLLTLGALVLLVGA